MCEAMTMAGAPCEAPNQHGRRYCFHHDPERATERAAARRRGGLAVHGLAGGDVSQVVRLRSADDVLSLLERAAGDLLARKPSVSRARALAYVGTAALRAIEVGSIEDRLGALEQTSLRGAA